MFDPWLAVTLCETLQSENVNNKPAQALTGSEVTSMVCEQWARRVPGAMGPRDQRQPSRPPQWISARGAELCFQGRKLFLTLNKRVPLWSLATFPERFSWFLLTRQSWRLALEDVGAEG